LAEKLKLVEEENEKLEAKINGLKQEYEKIGMQVRKKTFFYLHLIWILESLCKYRFLWLSRKISFMPCKIFYPAENQMKKLVPEMEMIHNLYSHENKYFTFT